MLCNRCINCFRVSQLFNTATLSYILPTHRATVYIMGILLGYYLHYHSSVPLKLSKVSVNYELFNHLDSLASGFARCFKRAC